MIYDVVGFIFKVDWTCEVATVHDSGRVLKKKKNYYVHIVCIIWNISKPHWYYKINYKRWYNNYKRWLLWLYVLVKFESNLKMYIEIFIVRLYLVKS